MSAATEQGQGGAGGPRPVDKVLELGGLTVHYTEAEGEGSPVLLVHGGASTRRDWAQNLPALAGRHRVLAPDLIGYGATRDDTRTYTIQDFARFLLDFLGALGIRRVHLVGHSLGGRACLEVVRWAPTLVGKLVLVAPVGFGPLSLVGRTLSTAGWAISRLMRKPLPYPDLRLELEDPAVMALKGLDLPALVLWGRWDPYFPHRYAQRVLKALPGARFHLLTRSAHAPHKEEPDAFNRLLLEFLSSYGD